MRDWCIACGHPQNENHNDSVDDPCTEVCKDCKEDQL